MFRKNQIYLTFLASFLIIGFAHAIPVDVNIYSSTTIEDGDEYGTVNIYDTPPDQTIVDMTGGDISYCNVYDTAILNCSGGDISFLYVYEDANTTISSIDGMSVAELYDNGKLHMHNGPVGVSNCLIYGDAQLHIYGYNLYYDEIPAPDWITGQWENGQAFQIYLRNINGYNPNQVFLHEIPEPITIILFGVGWFLKRKVY